MWCMHNRLSNHRISYHLTHRISNEFTYSQFNISFSNRVTGANFISDLLSYLFCDTDERRRQRDAIAYFYSYSMYR